MAHSLDPLFRPESVAVVGASASPGSVGSILMRNLMANPFGGAVYPVNPRRRAVHGVHCYPRVADLPEPIDLAIIATPADTVPGIVEECTSAGIKGTIIISAGFAELGEDGRRLEQQILAAAHGRMRVIGPNCLGVIHAPYRFNASFAGTMPNAGKIALLSQSGAICTAILDWAREENIGFSGFVSVGSMIDVDFADLIDYFADDVHTQSIILYMESIGNARKFLSAARAVARTKPMIVVKSGRHEAGARAAASHTGALAGSDAVFDAAFRRAGILRVVTIPELFDMAEILAMQTAPRGSALAIITNAGGPGVMATDALMLAGGQLAELAPESRKALDSVLPPFWSHGNPIDILGDATPERYRSAVEICARDRNVQGLLVILSPQAMTDPTETARQVMPFARLEGKPILTCWLGGAEVREGRRILSAASIPTYASPEGAIGAFLKMVQYRRNQELLYETPQVLHAEWSPDADRVRSILDAARAEDRVLLNEAEAKEVLTAYGIPVTQTVACRTVDEAAAAAARIGFPVVVKLLSQKITHKSDVGGVQLNLPDAQAVRGAFERIRANLAERDLADAFDGVTVQRMVSSKGFELIVGSSVDRQFGPVVLFGAGGVLVEVDPDRALGLPPLTQTLARRLIEQTRIFRALQGVRHLGPVSIDELEELLIRFSRLVADFSEIAEIDINPVLASEEQIIGVDARVLLGPADVPEEARPRLAIHPYPNQYTSSHRLADDSELLVRAIRPEDESLIVEFHAGHSEHTIRMRYFGMVRTLSRESLIRLCHLDYDRELALVAIYRDSEGRPHITGVSRYYLRPETGVAEFALVVGDHWQRKGLGTHLMQRLIAIASERGVLRLVGPILRENDPMISLVRKLGFEIRDTADKDVVQAVLGLVPEHPENLALIYDDQINR
jgi:acetyltransferase